MFKVLPIEPSPRAALVEARTYLRPKNDDGTVTETPDEMWDRVIAHQRWLWQRAKGGMQKDANGAWVLAPLRLMEELELEELRSLFANRKVTVAGRTRWLGGTPISRERESTQFNCAALRVQTVHDVVDAFWLLLQGCGVGFTPVAGTLNGFAVPMEVEVIRSKRSPLEKGCPENFESIAGGVWKITIGDSAEAWARALGKILAGKHKARKIVLDFSQLRGAGARLRQYGWISAGDEKIAIAFAAICRLMSARADQLLTKIDILDILNWIGTVLSSRRSAEIALMTYGDEEWEAFARAKKDHWSKGQPQRSQSNNSLVFEHKPTAEELDEIFDIMIDAGGSEPGFINGREARRRAPWFSGINPCAEILLPDRGFCNLVETMIHRFNGDFYGALRAHYLVARANYRQTCVDLNDGVLQSSWHQNNEFLRLCGVGVTGVMAWEHLHNAQKWEALREAARHGANTMANELGMPPSKAVTTVKPAGTQSKAAGTVTGECPEGLHLPIGAYIFNNIRFSKTDPLVAKLKAAGYDMFEDPYDSTTVLVTFPVDYSDVDGFTEVDGKKINLEPAIAQLERYKLVMESYVDHNASVTIYYSLDEVDAIKAWLLENWDSFVGVSFLYRPDVTKTAEDLGYPYLPQQVVDEATFREYTSRIRPVNVHEAASEAEFDMQADECAGGACPIR